MRGLFYVPLVKSLNVFEECIFVQFWPNFSIIFSIILTSCPNTFAFLGVEFTLVRFLRSVWPVSKIPETNKDPGNYLFTMSVMSHNTKNGNYVIIKQTIIR